MARFNYNVDTTRKYIDVHKQFQGGLKTVDTDDALGAVYLRDAENVSLSEFGFLEKRYGTYENFAQRNDDINATSFLQGYWEFKGYIVYAMDGKLYSSSGALVPLFDTLDASGYEAGDIIDGSSATDGVIDGVFDYEFEQQEGLAVTIEKENADYRYPLQATLDAKYPFQTERDVNAVNVNNVLYIFTGSYPIYVKEVNNVLRFYWLPVHTPTYDEIVITGHNLLEEDYDDLYYGDNSTLNTEVVEGSPAISTGEITPMFGSEQGANTLNFYFKPTLPSDALKVFNSSNPTVNNLYELKLEKIEYRPSSSGASDLDLVEADLKGADYTTKTNFISGNALPVSKNPIISNGDLVGAEVRITNVGTANERAFYKIGGSFTINKSDFLKEDNYKLRFFRESATPGVFTKFDLTLYQDLIQELPYYEITPIDVDGTLYTGNKVKKLFNLTDLTNTGDYEIVVPGTDELIAGPNISSYQVYFYEDWVEIYGTNNPQGPIDIETNPEKYFFTVFALEEFSPSAVDNRIASNATGLTNFSFTGLSSGLYDFKVTFALRSYDYNSQTSSLEQASYQVFSNYAYEQRVIVSDFEDLPGLEDVGAKAKAVWTCNRVIEHFNKLMIWGSEEMPNSVFYSFPDRPTYFPQNFYLDFGNDSDIPIQAVTPYMNILVVQTAESTWGVRGNSGLVTAPAPYTPFTINSTVGALAWKSVRPVRNHLFFLSKQGIIALKSLYAADEQYNIEFVDRNIRNIVPQDADAVGIQYDNQYWLNFPESGITLRWYIDKKAWVLDRFNAWTDFKGVQKWQIDNGKLEFISYISEIPNSENVAFYKVGIDYSLPTDLGETIATKVETSFLNQNYPFHPKNYKEAKLDFTLQNEYNLSKDALAIYPWESTDEEKAIVVGETTYEISSVPLVKNHRYRLTWVSDGAPENLDQVIVNVDGKLFNKTAVVTNSQYYIEFLLDNDTNGVLDILFNAVPTLNEGDELDLRDVTYDDELNFLIQVVSEDNILNQDLYQGYNTPQFDMEISLKDRLGDWTFGQTDFGKKVTAVDTIKLSGKGYNSKIYFEDTSKSKWTLESIGITFKMKRARSR